MALLIVDNSRETLSVLRDAARELRLGPTREARDVESARRLLAKGGVRFVVAAIELATALGPVSVPLVVVKSDWWQRRPRFAAATLRRPFHVAVLPQVLERAYRAWAGRRRRLVFVAVRGAWRPRGWDVVIVRSVEALDAELARHGNDIGALVVDPRELDVAKSVRRYVRTEAGRAASVACLSRKLLTALPYRSSAQFFVEEPSDALARALRRRLLGRWRLTRALKNGAGQASGRARESDPDPVARLRPAPAR